jgi:hypothetical protein
MLTRVQPVKTDKACQWQSLGRTSKGDVTRFSTVSITPSLVLIPTAVEPSYMITACQYTAARLRSGQCSAQMHTLMASIAYST